MVAEAGMAGYQADNGYGVVARAGTPAEIIVILNAAISKDPNTAEMKEN